MMTSKKNSCWGKSDFLAESLNDLKAIGPNITADNDISTDFTNVKDELILCDGVNKFRKICRKNYNCYVDGCKSSFKYLYLFKYHLAIHSIYNFDCEICGKRFLKYLEFKKHFKAHSMSILGYKVKSSEKYLSRKLKTIRCEKSSSYAQYNYINHNFPTNEEKRDLINTALIEIIGMLQSNQNVNLDFCLFDQSVLMIKDHDFPSYSCLNNDQFK